MRQICIAYPLRTSCELENMILLGNQKQQIEYSLFHKLNTTISGEVNSGKTYLLHAMVNRHTKNNNTAIFIDSKQSRSEYFLDALRLPDFIAIDNIDKWFNNKELEEKLLNIFKHVNDKGKMLWCSVSSLKLDTISNIKLQKIMITNFCVRLMALESKLELTTALLAHAKALQLNLANNAASYMVAHYSTNIKMLIGLLIFLENQARETKELISINFIKKLMHS